MANEPFTLQPTPSDSDNARCKGCGKMIVWAKNYETGKSVPLDPAVPVYLVTYSGETAAELTGRAMASHFSVCPNANQFSGSRRS